MIQTTFRIHNEHSDNGLGNFEAMHLFDEKPSNIETVAIVTIEPNEEIAYHIHEGDSELYYILSGTAIYNDNGVTAEIGAGTSTCTFDGSGHSIKNIGAEPLKFVAIIVK